MKKRIYIFLSLITVVILFFVINSHLTYKPNSIDLLTAYNIANEKAMEWNKESKPYFITSVDDFIKSGFIKGEDGTRRYWNFDFIIENTNKHLLVTIHDRKIVNMIEANSNVDQNYIINIDNLVMTTKEAAEIAKKQFNLIPGQNWAEGYHFVLESDDNQLILTVVGLNAEKKMVRIRFNALTKEVIN